MNLAMNMVFMETPSGKAAADENFPVGSWLVPARLRPHVAAFYAYARAIDDIADHPGLSPDDKRARLEGFARALVGAGATEPAFVKACALRHSLAETGVTPRHGLDLIRAFTQDTVKRRYADWADLMAYCNLSAAPVGRYLVDLHGESPAVYPASDALCNALQVLNHLQDCGGDYGALDRVYLPQDWMASAGADVEALGRGRCDSPLRWVLDRCLDRTDHLIETAAALPGRLRSRRFAMEAAVIVAIARKLGAELRRRDPLAGRAALTGVQYAACCARGIGQVWFERTLGQRGVRAASGSGARRECPTSAARPGGMPPASGSSARGGEDLSDAGG